MKRLLQYEFQNYLHFEDAHHPASPRNSLTYPTSYGFFIFSYKCSSAAAGRHRHSAAASSSHVDSHQTRSADCAAARPLLLAGWCRYCGRPVPGWGKHLIRLEGGREDIPKPTRDAISTSLIDSMGCNRAQRAAERSETLQMDAIFFWFATFFAQTPTVVPSSDRWPAPWLGLDNGRIFPMASN